MDIGFAGRRSSADPIHRAIAALRSGDPVEVKGRFIQAPTSQVVGRLAASVDETPLQEARASVLAVMVRTRFQTSEEYRSFLKVDRWETPILEVVYIASDDPKSAAPSNSRSHVRNFNKEE